MMDESPPSDKILVKGRKELFHGIENLRFIRHARTLFRTRGRTPIRLIGESPHQFSLLLEEGQGESSTERG